MQCWASIAQSKATINGSLEKCSRHCCQLSTDVTKKLSETARVYLFFSRLTYW